MIAAPARRLTELDAAKGIGIALVVIFHAYRGIVEAGGRFGPAMAVLDYVTYCFHMPLFFVIAGVFVERSLRGGVGPFVRAKLVSIYWPYLLWSVVTITLSWAMSRYVNKPVPLGSLITVAWMPRLHFWFLLTLFAFYLLAAAARDRYAMLALGIAGAVLAELPALAAVHNYLHFLIFFAVGMFGFVPSSRRWWASAALLVALAALGLRLGWDTQAVWLVPAGFAGYHAVLAIARGTGRGAVGRVLVLLGERSLAIYFVHVLAASGCRIALGRLVHHPSPWLLLAACTLAGVLVPLAAYAIAARAGVLTLTGLGRDARAMRSAPA